MEVESLSGVERLVQREEVEVEVVTGKKTEMQGAGSGSRNNTVVSISENMPASIRFGDIAPG